MSDVDEAVPAAPRNPYVVILIGRQSYDLTTQEYKLIPNIDTLARAGVPSPIEAFELYQHFIEISEILNEDISQIVDAYNEQVSKQSEDYDDEAIINTGEEVDEPSLDFSPVFEVEENTFLASIKDRIRVGGYSQISVYMEYRYADNSDEKIVFQPDSLSDITKFN